MFGGVYFWAAIVLAMPLAAAILHARPPLIRRGWPGALDTALAAVLAAIALQSVPLPAVIVSIVSPARLAYLESSSLSAGSPSFIPLALEPRATVHAWLAAFCTIAAFWLARAVFARGGVRTVVTAVAWMAIGVVLVALAQSAAGSHLVYGFWRPYDTGARPLGPFINRNHFGTWSLLALTLCYGCFEWRRATSSPSRGWSWRARLAHALDGRSMILALAVVLLIVGVALGASRSTMVALAAAAGYVALAAPARDRRRGSLRTMAIVVAGAVAFLAYVDAGQLLTRIDETRQLGLAQRAAIWRDTFGIIRDFPIAGVGAGNFPVAMRLYQTSDRTYFWNEAHNEYLQVAAEGGLLLMIPAAVAVVALAISGWQSLRHRHDHMHWMRLGASAALLAAAVQAIWETGLSLPANGMLAGVAAAILLHQPRHASNAAAGH